MANKYVSFVSLILLLFRLWQLHELAKYFLKCVIFLFAPSFDYLRNIPNVSRLLDIQYELIESSELHVVSIEIPVRKETFIHNISTSDFKKVKTNAEYL